MEGKRRIMKPDETHEFEWTAIMLNINLGHNRELLSVCKVLHEYAILIEKIRENQRVYKNTKKSIIEAIDECIRDNILAEFLLEHKSGVVEMCLTEYDKEKTMRLFSEEERAKGRAEARRILLAVNQLNKLLIEQGREQDVIKAATDEKYQEQLLKEYNLL